MVKTGSYTTAVDAALETLEKENIVNRIWAVAHTVWRPEPTEISNRLGWLTIAERMLETLEEMDGVVSAVRGDGYNHVVLLGMGGSSLAPEVFRKTFGVAEGYLDLTVADSTDPGQVLAIERSVDLAKTLFVVATKSGGTVETLSLFKYFYNRVLATVGEAKAGSHFIAITDPGSKLITLANEYRFRHTFINDPNIGGRYSVMSFFGLVPASLVGIDVKRLIAHTQVVAENAHLTNEENLSAVIGTVMGELAKLGRDKLTFLLSPAIASFGDWVEQLIAESTGKEGKGILPVVGESALPADAYANDRLFVWIKLAGDETHDSAVAELKAAGQPVITLTLDSVYDLGGQFFLWEFATAVAGHLLDIQPFDQPNVESAKIQARKMVQAYQETGELPSDKTEPATAANLQAFLSQAKPGDYVSLQAYVPPTAETDAALQSLRTAIQLQTGLAVTVGYGPRFLHSTGQLHKGDAGNGLFIQFTAEMPEDIAIPDQAGSDDTSISFGVLKTAQALGDAAALRDADRRLIHFHLSDNVARDIEQLLAD